MTQKPPILNFMVNVYEVKIKGKAKPLKIFGPATQEKAMKLMKTMNPMAMIESCHYLGTETHTLKEFSYNPEKGVFDGQA